MISIITPHIPSRADLIAETYTSILSQEVEWEWIVQIDGSEESLLPVEMMDDPRVKVEVNGRKLMVANTRNLAITRAQGEFIYPLDDDDILLDGALGSLLLSLEENSDCAGATGVPMFYDGEELTEWVKLGFKVTDLYDVPGKVSTGGCWERRRDTGSHLLASGPGFLWRTDAIWEAGGWAALDGAEDSALLYQINARHPIWIVDKETLGYRLHSAQQSQSADITTIRNRATEFFVRMLEAIQGDTGEAPIEKPNTLADLKR